MKGLLVNTTQGHQWIQSAWQKMKPFLENGGRLVVEIKDEKRTIDQNSMYHSIIYQISKQAQHIGSKWDAESWKRLLVDSFMTELGNGVGHIVPNLTGTGIVQLNISTRKFTKQQASDFTEWLFVWCAENGVDLDAKGEIT